jgi:hypothetical protein
MDRLAKRSQAAVALLTCFRGRSDRNGSSHRLDPVLEADQAGASGRIRATDPVVANR